MSTSMYGTKKHVKHAQSELFLQVDKWSHCMKKRRKKGVQHSDQREHFHPNEFLSCPITKH